MRAALVDAVEEQLEEMQMLGHAKASAATTEQGLALTEQVLDVGHKLLDFHCERPSSYAPQSDFSYASRLVQTLVPAVISARSRLRTEFDDVDMDGIPLAMGK